MTRIIPAIFIVYIALISLQPCDEVLSRAGAAEPRAAAAVAWDVSESGDPECLDCSPFCICSCCHLTAAFSYTFRAFERGTPGFSASELVPEYENASILGHSNSIWQPPKA